MVLEYNTHFYEGTLLKDAVSLWVPAIDLYYFVGGEEENETVLTGDWSFEVALPQHDIGYFWQADQVIGTLDGAEVTLEKVYLSPMTLELTLVREGTVEEFWADENENVRHNWWNMLDQEDGVILTARDGTEVTLTQGGGSGALSQIKRFYLEEVTDPAKFQGGTLTLNWDGGKAVIPLDQLSPVDQ